MTGQKHLYWSLVLLLGGLLALLAGRRLAEAPALDLELELSPSEMVLRSDGRELMRAPRPAGPRALSLVFYEDGIRFEMGRQRLAWARRVEPAPAELEPHAWDAPPGPVRGHGEWSLDGTAPAQARYLLRVLSPEDLNLNLVDARRNGVSLVLRTVGQEQGWCERVDGRFGRFHDQRPLGTLGVWTARGLGGEALGWLGGGIALAGLTALFAWMLARLPQEPVDLRPPRGAVALAAGFAFVLALASLLWGGHGLAHVTDEISNLFQARLFAAGQWTARTPPDARAFFMEHILADGGGWRSKYAPLWALLLAPFAAGGVEWLAGPLWAALVVLLAYGWAREAAGRAEALALAALLAFSPQLIWLSGSYFNHAPSLAATLLLLWGAWRGREKGSRLGWGAAAFGGLLLAGMRPYTAACLGAALGLWALGAGGWRSRGAWAGLASVAAAMATAMLVSNALGSGSPFRSTYILYDALDKPGFGPGLGSLPTWGDFGHTPLKALASLVQDLRDLRWRLLGWPLGLSGGLLALSPWTLRWTRLERLLALAFGALVLGHLAYWASILLNLGTCYWFEALACAVWLSLRSAAGLAERLQAAGYARARQALGLLFTAGALWSSALLLPAQSWTLRGFAKVDVGLAQTVAPLGPALRGLVFVPVVEPFDYNGAFGLNGPFLDGRFVFVRSQGPARDAALAALYPSRRPLRLERGVLRPWRPGAP